MEEHSAKNECYLDGVVRTRPEKELDELDMSFGCREMQRRPAVFVLRTIQGKTDVSGALRQGGGFTRVQTQATYHKGSAGSRCLVGMRYAQAVRAGVAKVCDRGPPGLKGSHHCRSSNEQLPRI